jgi:hypothetical protein
MSTDVIDAEVVVDREAAERLDKRIRLLVGTINDNITKLDTLVQEAKVGQIHVALDFPSWTAYVADVFQVQVRLDREQRRELVSYLSGEGMSQRAIASVVGVDQKTVSNDLRSPGEENSSLEAEPVFAEDFFADEQEMADCMAMAELSGEEFDTVLADARAEEDLSREHVAEHCRERAVDNHPEPAPVTGLDGKTYKRKPRDEQRARDNAIAPNPYPAKGKLDNALRLRSYDAQESARALAFDYCAAAPSVADEIDELIDWLTVVRDGLRGNKVLRVLENHR